MKSTQNWTKEDAVSFIEGCMIWIGAGFHPDTDMKGYVNAFGFTIFSEEDAAMNQKKLNLAFELLGDDIYEVGMELGYKLGYYPRPDDQKVKLTVLFGEDAINEFESMDANIDLEERLDMAIEDCGTWDVKTFDTQAEADAYTKGLFDSEGDSVNHLVILDTPQANTHNG
jgi:hypothetical protein